MIDKKGGRIDSNVAEYGHLLASLYRANMYARFWMPLSRGCKQDKCYLSVQIWKGAWT